MSNFVRNSSLYLFASIVLKATNFLLLPLYSSLIPPEGYGQVYIVSSIIAFLSLMFTFSMQTSMQRYYFNCKNELEVKRMFTTISLYVFVISLTASLLLLFFSKSLSSWLNLSPVFFRLAIYTVFLQTFYQLIIALLYAKQEAVKISLASIGIGVAQIIIQLILVLNIEDKSSGIVISMFISGILQFILFLVFSFKYLSLKTGVGQIKDYLTYGLSQLPSDISTWIVSLFDRLILNRYHNTSAVGIYGMGNTFASIPNVIYLSMNKALVPVVFEDYKKNETGVEVGLKESTTLIERIFVLITMLVSILLVFSKDITHVFLDKAYEGSSIVMFLVMIACLIDIYRILFMNPLAYNVKYVKIKSFIWVIASAASIALNFILIPRFSYYGACATLIIVNSFTCLMILHFAHKALPVPYHKKQLIEVLIVSMAFSMCFFITRSWMLFVVKVFLTLFYAFLVLKIYPIPLASLVTIFRKNKK